MSSDDMQRAAVERRVHGIIHDSASTTNANDDYSWFKFVSHALFPVSIFYALYTESCM